MILLWAFVWVVCNCPHVHPWNDWFITLLIALVLL